MLVQGFFSFGLRANPEISFDNPELLKLPFGVAVAISTIGLLLRGPLGCMKQAARVGRVCVIWCLRRGD